MSSTSMNLAVWRAYAPDFDVDAFLAEHPQVTSEVTSWHRGDVRVGGRVFEDSGFCVTVADAETFPAAVEDVRAFFNTRQAVLEALHARGVSSMIDFGVDVGTSKRFAACLRFSVSDLQWFARLGVELGISAYPASDDEEEEKPE